MHTHNPPSRLGPHFKYILSVAVAVSAVGLIAAICAPRRHPVGNREVPNPIKPVDLNRYLGRWYELARYEQFFQKDCDEVVATYSMRPDGLVNITNECRQLDGSMRSADARARILPGSANAKLKVSFLGPFYIGNYWVLDHSDDYAWSIVGDPTGRYLWILHRDAAPGAETIKTLVLRAEALGYDTSMLRFTRHVA